MSSSLAWPDFAPSSSGDSFDRLLKQLADQSSGLDEQASIPTAVWPSAQFRELADAGVLGWVIPCEFGGTAISATELLAGYIRLAEACLTSTFILTQRNGACQRIAASANEGLRTELLPPLARGELFATVGISHLTTSRQHWQVPTVRAEPISGGFRLDGEVPWVTGAARAQVLVSGGTLPDGRQILAAIPTDAAGVTVGLSTPLMGLSASQTAAVRLDRVEIREDRVLFGPVEKVMQRGGGGGTGSFGTSALAAGLSRRAIAGIEREAEHRADLTEIAQQLRQEVNGLLVDLERAAAAQSAMDSICSPETLRQRANSLVLRATQAWLAASKGAGYVAGHPAGRSVREALFFLVWSCPQPVVNAALRELACRNGD
jgi:alkylation response protein AidB-like acyl-CoA dehydrogenase